MRWNSTGYRITGKADLNAEDFFVEVEAPEVAERWRPGSFVILLLHEKGERIPLSVQKVRDGRLSLLVKRLGKSSWQLYREYGVGSEVAHLAGPLGKPIELKEYGNVVVVSDLVCGHAENYAISSALREINGNYVISIQSFKDRSEVYPEEFLTKDVCHEFWLTTLNGSAGIKGHFLDVVAKLLEERDIDIIFGGGELASLWRLAELTKPYGIPTIVTVRQIMVDGTGMCGSCRVLVDGKIKFACVDGPMFDAHKVSFEDALRRLTRFEREEKLALERYLRGGAP